MFGERGPSLLMTAAKTAVRMVVKWLQCITGLGTNVTSFLESFPRLAK